METVKELLATLSLTTMVRLKPVNMETLKELLATAFVSFSFGAIGIMFVAWLSLLWA